MTPRNPSSAKLASLPWLRTVGLTGILVTFGDQLSEVTNRAALAFQDAVDGLNIDGVTETSTSLVSTFIQFDPTRLSRTTLQGHLQELAGSRDWSVSQKSVARRLWRVKASFGGEDGPHLEEVAQLADLTPEAAINQILDTRVRVITIGFAPGQPYLGTLPPNWDFPRLPELIPRVPAGSLVVALRQLVLFTNDTPTGWRQIGQTAFRNFEPDHVSPFRLRTGDEMEFVRVGQDEMRLCLADPTRATAAELVELS